MLKLTHYVITTEIYVNFFPWLCIHWTKFAIQVREREEIEWLGSGWLNDGDNNDTPVHKLLTI